MCVPCACALLCTGSGSEPTADASKGLLVESSNRYRLQQIINDYKVVIFYPLVDAP
eukprot:COSAG01_NODE_69644_length_260_cov_23.397516_1_plen_55_part_01